MNARRLSFVSNFVIIVSIAMFALTSVPAGYAAMPADQQKVATLFLAARGNYSCVHHPRTHPRNHS
jgi:hypothetical protein